MSPFCDMGAYEYRKKMITTPDMLETLVSEPLQDSTVSDTPSIFDIPSVSDYLEIDHTAHHILLNVIKNQISYLY